MAVIVVVTHGARSRWMGNVDSTISASRWRVSCPCGFFADSRDLEETNRLVDGHQFIGSMVCQPVNLCARAEPWIPRGETETVMR